MPQNVVSVRVWGTSRAVTIPKFIIRELKWRVGQLLYISVENDQIVLRPLALPKGAKLPPDSVAVTDGDNTAA